MHLPDDLPVSLPAQLVEQRPDVRAAQEQLHPPRAPQIGVATANILPNVTIGANAGYMGTALPGLFSAPNLFWELAGTATQTAFDGGILLHELQQSKDIYHAAAWSYKGTVLGVVQNVADALRAVENDADALKAARDFERAAKISFDLAQQQMQTGYANILILLDRPADLSAGGHRGRAGARRAAQRHGRALSGARRRLVEPRRTAGRKNPRGQHRRGHAGRRQARGFPPRSVAFRQ